MQIVTIFLLGLSLQVAAEGYSQTVSFSGKDVPLEKIFSIVKKQTGYVVVYGNRAVRRARPITVSANNLPLETFLRQALDGQDFGFVIEGNTIFVRPKAPVRDTAATTSAVEIPALPIHGKLSNSETNEPLAGASITIKGTRTTVVSDAGGSFTLNAKAGDVLVISYVGFEPRQVTVSDKADLTLALNPMAGSLNSVVVVGYGTQKEMDVTGAISSVKGDDLEKTPATTFVQSLQGRSPGVDIKAASNAPGGGMRIRIRGTNSINASSEPLYVIDGFPIVNTDITPQGAGNQANPADPLSSISPNEIESIEVLKDASASAIYGSRGANGVVLITTKRGKTGKAKIDFDYSLNISKVRKTLALANAQELATLTNEWAVNNNQPLFYDGVTRPLPEQLGEGTNWQDAIFRTALTHNYNLSISGGTDNTKYLIAGNYLDQDGIIIESNFKRAGLKFNLDQKVGNRIKIGVNMNANRTVNDAVPSDGTGYQNDSPLWNALATTPAIPVMDENGNYVNNQDEGIEKILENPVSIAKTRTDITYATRLLSNAFADIRILEGLTFRANFGADVINSKRNVYIPNTAKTQALPNLGVASIGTVQSLNWLAEYTLTYNKEIGNHRFNVLAGYTAQNMQTESVFSRTDDFSTNNFQFNNLGAGSDPRPSTSAASEAGLLSLIGRINYAFKDKYLFTGTIRRDGSSKFGEANKWGMFPSVGLAWRINEENFLKNASFLSNLKLRTSYGLTGNQDIGSYSSLALYNTTTAIIAGSPVIGFYPNRIANPDLKWEKTAQFNVGLDAGFWGGKFNVSAEYYNKRTNDLLLNVTIPNQSGYGNSVQNIGQVENKGVEFSVGYNQSLGEVKWNSSFNISFNRNKVISLPEGTDRLLFGIGQGESAYGQSIAVPGQPLGSFFGYHFLGIWQTEDEVTKAGNTVGGVNRPGLPRYDDLNGDGFRQNEDDRRIIGNPNPDFIYGFSNELSYKNFSLFVFINGSYGNQIADLNRIGLLTQPQKHNVLQIYYDQRWTGPGTSNTIEAPLSNAGEWKNFSDRDILDGSYLRVKTITLSYNFSRKLLRADWLKDAQLYVSGENLITVTHYTGFDPEVDLYSSSNTQMGVDNGAYPASKSVRVGVKLGF